MDKELDCLMKKALVIGGTGFIGSYISNFLYEKGFKVSIIRKSKEKIFYTLNQKIKIYTANIENLVELNSCGIVWDFNLIVNCGGYVNHDSFSKSFDKVISPHLVGTVNIAKLSQNTNLEKFIHIGSSDEYGNPNCECSENMREMPLSPYSYAKVAATHFLQMLSKSEGYPAIIVRPFLVYGKDQMSNRFLPYIVDSCIKNVEFELTHCEQTRDFLYISDFVNAVKKIIDAPIQDVKGRIFNISSGESYTLKEVVEKVLLIAKGGKPLFGKRKFRENEALSLISSSNFFKDQFKWKPLICLNQGLRELYDYRKIYLDSN